MRSSGTSLDDPGALRVEARHPPAGLRVLDVALPVPDQPADVELVVQQAGAAQRVAADGGIAPRPAAGAGHALGVEPSGDLRAASGRRRTRGRSARTTSASPSSIIAAAGDRVARGVALGGDRRSRSRGRRRSGPAAPGLPGRAASSSPGPSGTARSSCP